MKKAGDILGEKAKKSIENTVKNTIGEGGAKSFVGNLLGDTAGALVGDSVNEVLEKTGIQKGIDFTSQKLGEIATGALHKVIQVKELDGSILIKLPFAKGVEKRIKEACAVNPEWNKICAHIYANSIKNETIFYDLDGTEIYKINKTWRNMKHVVLLQGDDKIGIVQKKTIMVKNPFSWAEPYRYSIKLRDVDLGSIEIKDRKLNPCVTPDFDTWRMEKTGALNYKVFDEAGKVIAEVWYVTENNYIFDYSDSFNPELLILVFIAIEMRDVNIRSKR